MSAPASLELLVDVLATAPLRLHVSLHRPGGADGVAWVPRVLHPLGAFVRVIVRDSAGEPIAETSQPKFTPKLKPGSDDSYVPLDPGHSHGTVVELDLGQVPGGAFRLEVTYTNLDYQGTPERPVGVLEVATERELILGE